MQTLNVQKQTMNERYLGTPVYVGQCRTKVFAYLKERIWLRIQGWKEKMLSWAGKEILVKAVAQAIPTYVMGCFDLTKEMCDQISTMIGRYWWSNQDKDNKIHWLRWEKLTQSKEDILKAKYFPEGDILSAQKSANMSYTWRSILKGVEVLKDGIVWRVGDGSKINMWKDEDPWRPRVSTRKPITPKGNNLMTKAAELVDPTTGTWDEELVRQTFWPQDAKDKLATPTHPELEDLVSGLALRCKGHFLCTLSLQGSQRTAAQKQ